MYWVIFYDCFFEGYVICVILECKCLVLFGKSSSWCGVIVKEVYLIGMIICVFLLLFFMCGC